VRKKRTVKEDGAIKVNFSFSAGLRTIGAAGLPIALNTTSTNEKPETQRDALFGGLGL
jgi:hypothetical protein